MSLKYEQTATDDFTFSRSSGVNRWINKFSLSPDDRENVKLPDVIYTLVLSF